MALHNIFGAEAENWACEFLTEQGYQILEKNFRYQKGEIDLIAFFENEIIFIEVKARKKNSLIPPEQAVNHKKIKLLISTAHHYLTENEIEFNARFDIISIEGHKKDKSLIINHIKDAFSINDDS